MVTGGDTKEGTSGGLAAINGEWNGRPECSKDDVMQKKEDAVRGWKVELVLEMEDVKSDAPTRKLKKARL